MKRLARAFAALVLSGIGPLCACDGDPGKAGDACKDAACCPTDSMVDRYPGDMLMSPLEPQPEADACVARKHDAILVLGCPSNDDGSPSACQEKRADLAVRLRDAGLGDRFITSGGAVANEFVEAEALRDLLVDRGVASEDVLLEPRAEHTDENLYFSSRIMEKSGYRSAVVVSDTPGHLLFVALCDANCCVKLGRLTVFTFDPGEGPVVAGHYVLFPDAERVSDDECAQIEQPSKLMCINLDDRRACADHFEL